MPTEVRLDVQGGGNRMVAKEVLQSLMCWVPLDMVAHMNYAGKPHANNVCLLIRAK